VFPVGRPDETGRYALLETKLGHVFQDGAVLETALTHRSYLNEHPGEGRSHNERLEFLGDAVLDLAVRQYLMERYPDKREGELSMLRSQVVSEAGLAEVAIALGLGDWLFLGRGEETTGGRRKASILADAFEALVAAVYLDGGLIAADRLCRSLFASRLPEGASRATLSDWKTRLQERAQALRIEVKYEVVKEAGPDHEKQFEVVLWLAGEEAARTAGRSKKEAEQKAAQVGLGKIGG
jgi:ribonuclease III